MANEKSSFEVKEGVFISADVVAVIAGLSATEVEGVSCLAGGIVNGDIEKLSAARLSRAIKIISHPDDSITIRLALEIAYGYGIPEVTANVQTKVGSSIENMTGIKVSHVDIKIASVAVPGNH